jgi:C1A family cysteine protease/predicted secreted protein
MKFTEIHINKRLASALICVILLLGALLPFINAIAAPPLDDPDHGEIKLGAADDGRQIELKEGQVLVVSLESNPSTGYMWEAESIDETILRQMGKAEFEPESHLLGAPAKQILRFEAVAAGRTTLSLVYHRPWEKDVKPAGVFSLQVQGVGSFTQAKSPAPTTEPSVESLVAIDEQPVLGLPASFNWCDTGGCTPVQNQGRCGSCWAFSTVGALESNIRIQDGVIKDLAEQYLLSCNTDGWDCGGGWWAHDYHLDRIPSGEPDAGAVYEADFPYTARDDSCNPPHTHHEKIISWSYIGPVDGVPSVATIKQAIYDHGPVSVGICVGSAFQAYSGGVFETNECSEVNHAVLLVGWDDSQGTSGIWYLKNSWGTDWGESGYMRIGYGTSQVGFSANYIVYGSSGCQDPYESDNDYTNAKQIVADGALQHHTFHEGGDVDWAKFSVTAGSAYTITTSNLGASNNTVLELYDTDGTTKLRDDDCPSLAASCINNWTAPATGTYFAKVRHSSAQGGCPGYDHDLAVVSDSSAKITKVFLPVVMNNYYSGGPINGDFENGPTDWFEYSTHGWDLILPISSLPKTPHGGSWAVWLGGDYDEISYIQQQVTVPAGSPYLAYWHWIDSEDWCGYDFGGVIINNSTVVDVYTLCSSTNTGGWVKHVVNLSAYAGQSVSLQIRTETDSSINSNLFVDDVSFQASASSVPGDSAFFDLKNAMPKSDKTIPRDVNEGKRTNEEFLLRPEGWTTNGKVQ